MYASVGLQAETGITQLDVGSPENTDIKCEYAHIHWPKIVSVLYLLNFHRFTPIYRNVIVSTALYDSPNSRLENYHSCHTTLVHAYCRVWNQVLHYPTNFTDLSNG